MLKLIVIILLGALPSCAGIMADSLQGAIFMFEMQGRFAQARGLLERIAKSPSASSEERTQARFYLGKIAELADTPEEALNQYSKAQTGTRTPSVAYWLADRHAALTTRPDSLLLGSIRLSSPPAQTITGKHPGFLLANQQYWIAKGRSFEPAQLQLPEGATLHAMASDGYWFSDDARPHILRQLSFPPYNPSRSYILDSPIRSIFAISDFQTVATTQRTLYWLSNDRIHWKISKRYANCQTLGLYPPTRQLLLNCPDNALHFLSTEDGSERLSLALVDKIDRAIPVDNGIIVSSAGSIWFYRPHEHSSPLWRHAGVQVQDFCVAGDRIAILGADGRLALLAQGTGQLQAQVQTGGETLANLGTGLLATIAKDGLLTAFDTLLVPLWHYHFAQPLQSPPLITEKALYFPLRNGKIVMLAPHYYGKSTNNIQTHEIQATQLAESGRWDLASPYIDSLLALEGGNSTAWYLKAMDPSRKNAQHKDVSWAKAALYARGKPELSHKILRSYAQEIGALYIQYVDISPHTLYPRLFGDAHNLYLLDAAAKRLLCLSPLQGSLRWSVPLSHMEQSPIVDQDAQTLAIASGFQVNALDLSQKGRSRILNIPGKAFQLHQNQDAIYVSTWNGFLLKYQKPSLQLAWSHKLLAAPMYITENKTGLHLLSQNGELQQISTQSPQSIATGSMDLASTALFRSLDSLLIAADEDDQVRMNLDQPGYPPWGGFRTGSQILSLEPISLHGIPHALIGLNNQQLILYNLKTTRPIWKYQGQGSVFVQPVLDRGLAWIDQKDALVAISLDNGRIVHRLPIPGGGGQIFISNGILYSVSSQQLLYAFMIPPSAL
jgi:outer membrane protein assembly factor BamB